MKSDLEARPIYLWTEASTRGHFVVCYLALECAEVTIVEVAISQEEFYIKKRGNPDTEFILQALVTNSIPQ